MKHRDIIKLIGVAAATSCSIGPAARKVPRSKPNVVILFIDDLGYGDVGVFGCSDIPTPNMDILARRGVKCTNSYVTNPPCSPSRCSLMMGMYGQRFGKYGMARGLAIPDDKPTMAEFMRDAGYVTGMIGKWDIGSRDQSPMKRGFMEVARRTPAKDKKAFICIKEDGTEGWRTEMDGDRMVEFVERNKEKPFFLYFSPRAVHSPSSETPERLRNRSTAKGKRRALAGDAGLLMCTWPKGGQNPNFKKHWQYMYFNECMTGFEWQVASHMIHEGMLKEGLAIARAIHDCYDASLRNPYNEIECSDHYARAMASYGSFISVSGFEYHGPKGHIAFSPRLTPENFKAAFTTAKGWGGFTQKRQPKLQVETIELKWGELRLRKLTFELPEQVSLTKTEVILAGKKIKASAKQNDHRIDIELDSDVFVKAGKALEIRIDFK